MGEIVFQNSCVEALALCVPVLIYCAFKAVIKAKEGHEGEGLTKSKGLRSLQEEGTGQQKDNLNVARFADSLL